MRQVLWEQATEMKPEVEKQEAAMTFKTKRFKWNHLSIANISVLSKRTGTNVPKQIAG